MAEYWTRNLSRRGHRGEGGGRNKEERKKGIIINFSVGKGRLAVREG